MRLPIGLEMSGISDLVHTVVSCEKGPDSTLLSLIGFKEAFISREELELISGMALCKWSGFGAPNPTIGDSTETHCATSLITFLKQNTQLLGVYPGPH